VQSQRFETRCSARTRLMPISRTTSAMLIGGCVSSGRPLAIIRQALMLNPRHRSAHEHLGEGLPGAWRGPPRPEQLLVALGKPLPHSVRGIRRSQSGAHRGVQKAGRALESRSDVARELFVCKTPRSALAFLMVFRGTLIHLRARGA